MEASSLTLFQIQKLNLAYYRLCKVGDMATGCHVPPPRVGLLCGGFWTFNGNIFKKM